jgi:hypothetical protein
VSYNEHLQGGGPHYRDHSARIEGRGAREILHRFRVTNKSDGHRASHVSSNLSAERHLLRWKISVPGYQTQGSVMR